jgi:hypothetical protein
MKITEIITEEKNFTFLQYCEAAKMKILSVAEPTERTILQTIPIQLSTDPADWDKIYSMPRARKIIIDEEEFKDAPISVLLWLIAHELGHLLFNHQGNVEPKDSQQQELDADLWANDIMKRIGITKVPVFTWLHRHKDAQGRSELQRRQELENDPENEPVLQRHSHPTMRRRQDQGKLQGIELSKNTDQIDWLLKHLA